MRMLEHFNIYSKTSAWGKIFCRETSLSNAETNGLLKERIIPWAIPLSAYVTRKRLTESVNNTNHNWSRFAVLAVRCTLNMCKVPRNHLWYQAPWILQHTHCQLRKFETCSKARWYAAIAMWLQQQSTVSMARVRLLAEARDLLHGVHINSGNHLSYQMGNDSNHFPEVRATGTWR
jgi:hypothetical protein